MSALQTALVHSTVAGIIASFACGVGALPLAWRWFDASRRSGLAYAFAAGLMFAASVYNLILPALTIQDHQLGLSDVVVVGAGILLGASFLWVTSHHVPEPQQTLSAADERLRRTRWLIFISMLIHSIPEGVAVGVGYSTAAAADVLVPAGQVAHDAIGRQIAVAITIHNIPEGLAVAIPMRATGASINKCFWAATLTSLPQPVAAIPACLAAWFFTPLMPWLMGFAAGAMIFLVILDLIPEALETDKPMAIAWSFILGFVGMLLLQAAL